MMTHSKISKFSKGSKLVLEFRTPHTPLGGECSFLTKNRPELKTITSLRDSKNVAVLHLRLWGIFQPFPDFVSD